MPKIKKHVVLHRWVIVAVERFSAEHNISFSEAVEIALCCLVQNQVKENRRKTRVCENIEEIINDIEEFYFKARKLTEKI